MVHGEDITMFRMSGESTEERFPYYSDNLGVSLFPIFFPYFASEGGQELDTLYPSLV